MQRQPRRSIRSDYSLSINAAGATPPPWVGAFAAVSAATPESQQSLSARPLNDVTRALNAIWSSDGGGQGGRPLDDALTRLGESFIEGGRIVWEPPADLDPVYTDYLSESVAQLNRLIERGVVVIDEEGNIRPVES